MPVAHNEGQLLSETPVGARGGTETAEKRASEIRRRGASQNTDLRRFSYPGIGLLGCVTFQRDQKQGRFRSCPKLKLSIPLKFGVGFVSFTNAGFLELKDDPHAIRSLGSR